MSHPIYFNNSIVTEEDIETLSQQFKVPYDAVAEMVAKRQQRVEISLDAYRGKLRERAEVLLAELKDRPENQELAPLKLSENDEVSDAAANHLINALVDPLHHNFIIIDGVCTINPDNPPDLVHSYQVVADVLKLRSLSGRIDDQTSWLLGSVVVELEAFHGEEFEISQVCNQTTRAYNTVWTAREVYKAFRNKRYSKVSFTGHKEAYFAKISEESKHLILHKAEMLDLSCNQIRSLCSIVKRMDDDTTIKNLRNSTQAEDLISAYRATKVSYIIYNDNLWILKKGLATEPPTGTVVINLKEMTVRKNGGPPELIQEYGKNPKKSKS